MTKIDLQKLSKINCASAGLEAAIVRVEKALVDQSTATSTKNLDTKSVKVLESEIIVLRNENARLKSLNKAVSERLDIVIGQLKDFMKDT